MTETREIRRHRVDLLWETPERADAGVSIYEARYGGAYEGALWYAVRMPIEWLDDDQNGDAECMEWFLDYREAPIGRGATPDAALADLNRIYGLGREGFALERGTSR